jgi:hypothetical protein
MSRTKKRPEWLRLEALLPFILLLAIIAVLLWLVVVLWPHATRIVG